MEPLILLGGGGHCKSCIDVIEQEGSYRIEGVLDKPEKLGQIVLGYEIIGSDDDLPEMIRKYKNVLICIGQIKSPNSRIELFKKTRELGANLPIIVSPLAHVSEYAKISSGTIIMHHAVVNADAKIGENCIINTKALVEHDAAIGDHCHIATNAVVNGGATISYGAFVGSNATIREGVEIGMNSVIGAGKVVLNHLRENSVVK